MSPAEANVGSSNSLLLFKQAASWPQLGSSEQWGQGLRILVLCRDAGSVYIHGPSPPCLSRIQIVHACICLMCRVPAKLPHPSPYPGLFPQLPPLMCPHVARTARALLLALLLCVLLPMLSFPGWHQAGRCWRMPLRSNAFAA